MFLDESGEAFAVFWFEDFGIVQTTDGFFGIEYNCRGDDGTEETATADFIDTGDDAEAALAGLTFVCGPAADGGHDSSPDLLCVGGRGGDRALFEAGGFALQLAQVVKLGAAHFAGADHIDVVDDRSVDGEDALDAGAEADLADGDGFAHADILARDDGAFKRLQAFLVAFFDADVDANGIAGAELGVSHLAGVLADEL